MLENNNKSIVSELSRANIKSNKVRNIFVGIIITLSVCLMTVVTCFAYNTSYNMKNQSKFHGYFLDVTAETLNEIKGHKDIDQIGVFRSAGANIENKIGLTIYCSDAVSNELQQVQCEKGSQPVKENEIMVEQGFLDKQFPGKKIGNTITISYRNAVTKEMQTKDFVISGLLGYGFDNINEKEKSAYVAVVSEAFIQSDPALAAQDPTVLFTVKNYKNYGNEELKTKIKEIGADLGFEEDYVRTNNYFIDTNVLSVNTIIIVLLVGVVILFACALVIYNIFYISIIGKVKEYGQLRTVGTTGKQIKKIIAREGLLLSLKYLPIGALTGLIISYFMPIPFRLAEDIIIMVGCTLIVFATVMFSVNRPGKIAAAISPIEATVYTPYRSKKKDKKISENLSPLALAKMNVFRNRKKSILTFLSLFLTGFLLIVSSSIMTSMDPSLRAKYAYPYGGEYAVELNSNMVSATLPAHEMQIDNPLNEALQNKIRAIDGVDDLQIHKSVYAALSLQGVEVESAIYNLRQEDYGEYAKFLTDGEFFSESDPAFDEIIVNNKSSELLSYGATFKLNDQISMTLRDGKDTVKKTFTVIGIIENSDTFSSFLLPDAVIDSQISQITNTRIEIISKQGYSEKAEEELRLLTEKDERLSLRLLKDDTEQVKNAFSLMSTALYAFIAFIGCFGIVNLINTNVTNMIAKKKELGVMEAVGMTSRQIRKMLFAESAYLTIGSFLLSVLFGGIAGYFISGMIGKMGGFGFVTYQFPFVIVVAYLTVILLVQFLLNYVIGRSLKKQTVIQRICEQN